MREALGWAVLLVPCVLMVWVMLRTFSKYG